MTTTHRRMFSHMDWPLFGAVLALTLIGLATIYSVTWNHRINPPDGAPGGEFWRQIYAIPVGLAAMATCLLIDYRTLAQRSLLLYAALIVALVYVAFFGVLRGGARRWVPLGGFSLQPSEFARIGVALVLATYFGDNRRSARSWGELVAAAALAAVPFVLIQREPDLGTALTLIPVTVGILYLAGLRLSWKWIAIGLIAATALSPLVWKYGLKDYQKQRIVTALNPAKDAKKAGYQQIQATVTVGSGGLFGKGFKSSTQGSYGFLPEAHNDFVFSVLAEEHGFVGVLVTLGLYLFVMIRSLDSAKLAKDRVGAYLVVGLVSGFACQVLYNITMSAGWVPVKGITLPLMSYGGSSLVATLAAFGLVLNVRMRRFTN